MSAQPYTHADHAQACQESAKRREVLQQWVQVKTSGSAHCARLIDAWSTVDGADFWKVQASQPLSFTGSFPVKSVRQCSGIDGRCVCAGEQRSAAEFDGFVTPEFSHGRVVAPRDSLNIEKTPLFAGV